MELFSVTCITCRATLKVRHVSAIGQILACPRCQGMVQIEPPPGWKPPAAALAPSAPSGEGEPAADARASSVHSGETESDRAADRTAPHDDPLTSPGPIVAPHEARLRRRILFGGLLAAALIIAFGIGTSFRDGDDDTPAIDPAPTTAVPTASPTSLSRIQQHLARAHATPIASAAASASATSSTATPSPPAPSATASPTATTGTSGPPATVANVTTTTTGTSNPVITTTAATTTPSAAIVTSTSGPTIDPPPPQPVPTATATVAPTVAAVTPTSNNTPTTIQDPPQVLPPPSIDLPARLQDRLPDVAFDGVPLASAFEIISQLSTIRIGYDWDSPAIVGLKLDEPLQIRFSGETVDAAIEKLLAEKKLRRRTIGDQLLVTGPEEPPTTTVEYPLDDLATEAEQREVVLGLVV